MIVGFSMWFIFLISLMYGLNVGFVGRGVLF